MSVKDIIKITLNLVIVYVIGGLILALVYAKTSPVMYRNAIVEKERALKKLMPEAERIDKLGAGRFTTSTESITRPKKGTLLSAILFNLTGKGIQVILIHSLRLIRISKFSG